MALSIAERIFLSGSYILWRYPLSATASELGTPTKVSCELQISRTGETLHLLVTSLPSDHYVREYGVGPVLVLALLNYPVCMRGRQPVALMSLHHRLVDSCHATATLLQGTHDQMVRFHLLVKLFRSATVSSRSRPIGGSGWSLGESKLTSLVSRLTMGADVAGGAVMTSFCVMQLATRMAAVR